MQMKLQGLSFGSLSAAIFLARVTFTESFSQSISASFACRGKKHSSNYRYRRLDRQQEQQQFHRWDLRADGTNYGGGDSRANQPSSNSDGDGPWKLDNTFDLFLNQCALQSLMFLINSLKDRHTAIWLEDFTRPIIRTRTLEVNSPRDKVLSNMASAFNDAMHETQAERTIYLLNYHGLAAINTTIFPTWESYFEQLLQEETITYTIESSRPHIPTYELDINPASLCSRIISVREQIAREFVHDLDVIAETSLRAMDTYWATIRTGNQQHPVGLARPNLLFLEMSINEDYTPSPLRKGNFDLLTLLTTQEAIHRILNRISLSPSMDDECPVDESAYDGGGGAVDAISGQYLRNFYTQRIGTHFTGSNFYGRADDFLDELVQTLPSVVQVQDEECGLVDPVRIVEHVLIEREKVASEWLEVALDVPQSHTSIKRLQLNKLMGMYSNNKESSPTNLNRSSFE